jgi:hypothetical protein
VIKPSLQETKGSPSGEKMALTATKAKGNATNDFLKVNPKPSFDKSFANNNNSHASAKANQLPSGKTAFEMIKNIVARTLTRGSRL